MTWFRAKKKSYEIWARLGVPNTSVYNILENAGYDITPGNDIVLSGTAGEQWVISREKFAKTYHVVNGNLSYNFKKVATNPSAGYVFAQQVKTVQQVRTSWGAVLTANSPDSAIPHGNGDFIVASPLPNGTPNLNDMWVVNGTIFRQTYDVEGMPSQGNDQNCLHPLPPVVALRDGIHIGAHKLQNNYVSKFLKEDFGNIDIEGGHDKDSAFALTELDRKDIKLKMNFWEDWEVTVAYNGTHYIGFWYIGNTAKALFLGYAEMYKHGVLKRNIELTMFQFKNMNIAGSAYYTLPRDLEDKIKDEYPDVKGAVKLLGGKREPLAPNDTHRLTDFIQHFDDMISKVEA